MNDDYEVCEFIDAAALRVWLDENHQKVNGVWLKIHKKDSGLASITYPEAVDAALSYGWIDGLRRSYDNNSYVQKLTPRRAKSLWSKRNIEHIERLTKLGLMMPNGLNEVALAKADGRWDAAYDGPASMTFSDAFLQELKKHPKAQTKFDSLTKSAKYALGWQLQTAKTEKTINSRQERIITMLENSDQQSFTFNYKNVLHTAISMGTTYLPKLTEIISVHALPRTSDSKYVVVNVRSRGIDMAGGHVEESDATLIDALSRELREEAEMTVKNYRLLDVLKVSSSLIAEDDRKYIVLYAAEVDTLNNFIPTDEISERLVLTEQEFAEQYFAGATQYIKHLFSII